MSIFKSVIKSVSSGVGDVLTSARANLEDQIGAFGSDLGFNKTGNFRTSAQDPGLLIFPSELRNQPGRPIIQFRCEQKETGQSFFHHVWFPCPGNLAVADSGNYSSINLGAMTSTALNAISAGQDSGQGAIGSVAESLKSIGKQVSNLSATEIAAIAAEAVPFNDQLGKMATFQAKVIINPNTNTTFEGNSIRSFGFQFKMIAQSKEESETIRKIHSKFRAFSYADSSDNSQNITLSYPPIWTIRFLDTAKKENRFLPKIFSCYLQSVTTNFNQGANMYYTDGAPIEVEMALNFQETRALTRKDIEDLEAGTSNRGVDPETGLAQRQIPEPDERVPAQGGAGLGGTQGTED